MQQVAKSNIISEGLLIAGIAVLALTGCMQDMVQKDYASDETGYEKTVVENAVKQASVGDKNAERMLPPVVVNNPYALASSLGNIEPAAGGNVQVINNNTMYSDLNAGMIKSGAFMQNNAPVYQQPTSFGTNYYSPTSGR